MRNRSISGAGAASAVVSVVCWIVVTAIGISGWIRVDQYTACELPKFVNDRTYNDSQCVSTFPSWPFPYVLYTCNRTADPPQVTRTAYTDQQCTTPLPDGQATPSQPGKTVEPGTQRFTYDPNVCYSGDDDLGYKFSCDAIPIPKPSSTGVGGPACPLALEPSASDLTRIDCFGAVISYDKREGPVRNGECERRYDCYQFQFDSEDCLLYDDDVLIDMYDCNGHAYPINWFNDRTCDSDSDIGTAAPAPRSYRDVNIVLNCSAKNFDAGDCIRLPACALAAYQPIIQPPSDDTTSAVDTYAAGTLAATALLFGLLAVWCVWHRRNSIRAQHQQSEQLANAQFAEVPLTAIDDRRGQPPAGGGGGGGVGRVFSGASFSIGETETAGTDDHDHHSIGGRSPIDSLRTEEPASSERARFMSADDAL